MKICVLQPDYSTSSIDYQHYDPPRNLSPLLPDAEVHHIFLNKLATYRQLKELSTQGYDCFVNLCEGYLDWDIPSIDVIYSLERLALPFTGPTAKLYDPPKEVMKYVAHTEGVKSPAYAVARKGDDIVAACSRLAYPLFVKPAHAGDSLGIDESSFVQDEISLLKKTESLWEDFNEVLIEEYIDGREFTVLVAANAVSPKTCTVFTPLEYIFPPDRRFKTYALKTSELHPECNRLVKEETVATSLKEAARQIFTAFGGVGYGRLDFRTNNKGELYFLEINFTCSVFYTDGYEGSADYIIKNEGIGQSGFLRHIIAEGRARHQRSQKKYIVRGNAIVGYGIYAATVIKKGDVIFCGEESKHCLVTRRYVEEAWTAKEQEAFAQYAIPISNEVYATWGKNPEGWAPQNHSCNANTVYDGLNVIAMKDVAKGEELTLDYTTYADEHAAPFECNCGAADCRKFIHGSRGASVTAREAANRLKKEGRKVIAAFENARIEEDMFTGQRSLKAARTFAKGDVITLFNAAEVLASPNHLTLQKDDGVHITLLPSYLQYVNHSCSPSAFFNTIRMEFVTLKNISQGEELTFFYPSAEWEMAQAFACNCGSAACLGTIQGAAFLPEEVLMRYRLTDFVRRKLEERKEERA